MKNRAPLPTGTAERELLLVGGGHAHLSVVRHFGANPVPGVRVTLLSRDVHTPYSGMLPGYVAGHYGHGDCHVDLRRLCEASGIRLIRGTATRIDTVAQRVEIDGRPALPWDWLSLDTGSCPALDDVPGAREHGVAVKPVDAFLARWERLLHEMRADRRPRRVEVVGGGAASVEIALALAYRLSVEGLGGAVTLGLVCAAQELLDTHNPRVRRALAARLAAGGVAVRTGTRVARALPDRLLLADGTELHCNLAVWAIHAGAPDWARASGLGCDARGFVTVDHFLRSTTHERIFAAGDLAALPVPVAKSGVYAVREGPVLARNLERSLRGEALRPYHPQRRFLSLLATGPRHAVASRGAFFASGDWVWRWKDRIDRRFMAMFRPAPLPPPAEGEEPAMRCGGCAAKVGGETLSGVLRTLATPGRGGVTHGLASAEDAAVIAPPPGQRLVQSVDYFRAFTPDPWLLGRIGAIHCLGDLHAMGARPHSALAIATVPHGPAARVRESLELLMLGAVSALDEDGVELAGGHSSEGAELGFGLCVNGFAAEDGLLLKSALRDGQALVLTKALGTGVLFAANMGAAAEGRWIEAALESMQRGHAAAAHALRAHGATACTDVTGFGLLGHLAEMLEASGIGARLDGAAIPALAGARECLAAGYRSSLHASNARRLGILQADAGATAAELALLVDPQTAGGLLASIPAGQAVACVEALRAAGFDAACVVGRVSAAVSPGRAALG